MPSVYIWNRAPFIRLLACFMAGIISQYAVGFDEQEKVRTVEEGQEEQAKNYLFVSW